MSQPITEPLPDEMISPNEASEFTIQSNNKVRGQLALEDQESFVNASKGFIASLETARITTSDTDKKVVFDLTKLDFLKKPAPDTVNPSLWRQCQLNTFHHGLFEVVPGIYQVRSYDLANMTLIAGDIGWIIIDPLTSTETSKAALGLANKHLGERPVSCVIYTHSHADHYAGARGVLTPDDAASGKISVIAPYNFVKEALSENVVVGNAMKRRAEYMYGKNLPASPTGYVGDGLGPDLAKGTPGFVPPNDLIHKTGESRIVDGIEIIFQMATDTEAVAEFVFYFPKFKALCTSEITSHHLHNVYTPRGAQIRDSRAWSNAINECITLFGEELELQFASHHWPTWGKENAIKYLEKQRDLYKYLHDQTLRLANHGFTKEEIAEQLTLPESLSRDFACRDYYGTIKHNSKAIYVKYLGYFDGNPANLDPLPPVEASRNYVHYMGGSENILKKAKLSYDQGEYRWVAQVLNHLVLAEPKNIQARSLLSATYEQLGYQAESGPWRNFYLTGAYELRLGETEPAYVSPLTNIALSMPLTNYFQFLSVRLNGPKADGKELSVNLFITDEQKSYLMSLKNAVLHVYEDKSAEKPDASLSLSTKDFKTMMLGSISPSELIAERRLELIGSESIISDLVDLFDTFSRRFPIVAPRSI